MAHNSLLLLTGLHRKRKATSIEQDETKLNSLLYGHTQSSSHYGLDVTDELVRAMRETEITDYHQVDKEKNFKVQDRVTYALLERVNQKIGKESNYAKLLWCLVFSFVYILMKNLEGDVTTNYELASSAQTTMINKLTSESELQYGTSLFGEQGTTSARSFYDWLNSSVLGSILTQPFCGVSGLCNQKLFVLSMSNSYGAMSGRTGFVILQQNILDLSDLGVNWTVGCTHERPRCQLTCTPSYERLQKIRLHGIFRW